MARPGRSRRVHVGDTPHMYCHVMDPALEKECGRWVAVGDTGAVVADGDSLADLHRRLDSVAAGVHVLVRRIPALDDPLFLGAAAEGWWPRHERVLVPARAFSTYDGLAAWVGLVCGSDHHQPEANGGVPCIRGLRIPVATVVGMIASGMTPTEVVEELPPLELADVAAALRFAADAVADREIPLQPRA